MFRLEGIVGRSCDLATMLCLRVPELHIFHPDLAVPDGLFSKLWAPFHYTLFDGNFCQCLGVPTWDPDFEPQAEDPLASTLKKRCPQPSALPPTPLNIHHRTHPPPPPAPAPPPPPFLPPPNGILLACGLFNVIFVCRGFIDSFPPRGPVASGLGRVVYLRFMKGL